MKLVVKTILVMKKLHAKICRQEHEMPWSCVLEFLFSENLFEPLCVFLVSEVNA